MKAYLLILALMIGLVVSAVFYANKTAQKQFDFQVKISEPIELISPENPVEYCNHEYLTLVRLKKGISHVAEGIDRARKGSVDQNLIADNEKYLHNLLKKYNRLCDDYEFDRRNLENNSEVKSLPRKITRLSVPKKN